MRWIIHLDMDAFFASVEQRDHPEWRGQPVVVGADPHRRGVVSAASYEARKYGIHSAMPVSEAYARCPKAIFVRPSMRRYAEASRGIMEILGDYSPLVEPLSMDEAFVDVTGCEGLFGSAEVIGRMMKRRIREELGLTASVGLAPNKFLAKLASDLRKPDGFVVVQPEKIEELLRDLPIGRLWGVGVKTEQELHRLGIRKIGDLWRLEPEFLAGRLGSVGPELLRLSRGLDDRPVETGTGAKSMGRETTYDEDVGDLETIRRTLLGLSDEVSASLRRHGFWARTVVLKLRYESFETLSRNQTLATPTQLGDEIYQVAWAMLNKVPLTGRLIRLIGVSGANLQQESGMHQLTLFDDVDKQERLTRLAQTIDQISAKHGRGILKRAVLLQKEDES